MRLSYVLYVLGLITVLLFAANCSCDTPESRRKHTWVICEKGNSTPSEFTAYGDDPPNSTPLGLGVQFKASEWSCPDTTGSPIWTNSATTVLPSTQAHAERRVGARATSAGSTVYLPQLLLDLPFPAQGPASQGTASNCSSSQPDVLQVNHDNASVNRITSCPGSAVTTIPVAGHPLQIVITPDGTTALVTSFDNAINFIDLASNKVTFTMPTSIHPNGITITSDAATAYVTNFVPSNATLVKIDLGSHTIVATMQVGTYPQSVFLSPDGAQLYVTYPYLNLVSIVDTLTFTEAYRLAVQAPRGIAFNSTGTKAYIASAGNPDNATSGTVLEFDTNQLQVTNTYNVGLGPNDVAVLYSDRYVITTNYEGQSVSMINTTTGTVQTISAGGQVSGLSIVQ